MFLCAYYFVGSDILYGTLVSCTQRIQGDQSSFFDTFIVCSVGCWVVMKLPCSPDDN